MFEQILQLVKEHLGNNPQIASSIPNGNTDAVHNEIATHINNALQNQDSGGGNFLSKIESTLGSGSTLSNSISGGLIGALTSKFGLPSAATGAIAAALPGLLQKLGQRSNPQTA